MHLTLNSTKIFKFHILKKIILIFSLSVNRIYGYSSFHSITLNFLWRIERYFTMVFALFTRYYHMFLLSLFLPFMWVLKTSSTVFTPLPLALCSTPNRWYHRCHCSPSLHKISSFQILPLSTPIFSPCVGFFFPSKSCRAFSFFLPL